MWPQPTTRRPRRMSKARRAVKRQEVLAGGRRWIRGSIASQMRRELGVRGHGSLLALAMRERAPPAMLATSAVTQREGRGKSA